MRLIDAEALRKIKRSVDCGEYIGEDVREITVVYESDINNAPTVDAVEVVRCKDCNYRSDNLCKHPRHASVLPIVYPNDFCRYGERKDNATPEATDHD